MSDEDLPPTTPEVPSGVGLGLRSAFAPAIADGAAEGRVAFLELAPENYIERGGRWPALLPELRARHPLVSHGLTLSLGGHDPLDEGYLDAVREFCQDIATPWHSDHLCFAGHDGARLHDLLPLPLTRAGAARVAKRVRIARERLGLPLLVENISQYLLLGESELDEVEFVRAVCEQADCGLLLDVNNVFVNARNFGFDPYAWLERAPLERVRQLHVAGHEAWEQHEMFVDTHGASVLPEVQAMMAWVVERIGPVPVLLERDTNIPPLAELLDEVDALARVYDEALARFSPGPSPPAPGPAPGPASGSIAG